MSGALEVMAEAVIWQIVGILSGDLSSFLPAQNGEIIKTLPLQMILLIQRLWGFFLAKVRRKYETRILIVNSQSTICRLTTLSWHETKCW